jgi:hypothetical protein
LPTLLGFPPTGSLIVIGGTATRPATTLAQYPLDGRDRQEAEAFWAAYLHVHDHAGLASVPTSTSPDDDRSGAADRQVTLIGYLEPGDLAGIETLTLLQSTAPLPVLDVAAVIGERWWKLDCPDPAACRAAGCHPLGAPLVGPDTDTLLSQGIDTLHPDTADPPTHRSASRVSRTGDRPSLQAAVAAYLPVTPTDDRATNQVIFRNVLDLQHGVGSRNPDLGLVPALAATLLQGLADPLITDGCLGWTDDAAWRLYLALVRVAPPRWRAPAWALIAAIAYLRGNLPAVRLAVRRALADQPDHALAKALHDALAAGTTPAAVRAALAERLTAVPPRLRAHLPGRSR